MISKIFHPNISKTGEICVDTLKKGWKREYGIGHVLVVSRLASCGAGVVDVPPIQTIKCLLIVPNPESALDEEAGKLLLEDYQEYYKVRVADGVNDDIMLTLLLFYRGRSL